MFVRAKPFEKERLITFLSREPEINLFMIADLEFYGMDNEFIKVWYDGPKELATVVLMYHKNLIFYSIHNDYDKVELMRIVQETQVEFVSCCQRCYEYIRDELSNGFNMRTEVLASMKRLIKPTFDLVPARIATVADGRKIAESMFKIDEFRDFITMDVHERARQNEKKIKDGFGVHFVIEEDGIIIANANTAAICSKSAMIGGVFTLPEHRNRGLATSIVYYLCEYLLKRNIFPSLFFENPSAATIYHRLGFVDIDEWIICKRI